MNLLTKKELAPLFKIRPDQRDYTLKRYFKPLQKIPFLARFKLVLKLLDNKQFNSFLDIGFGSGILIPELVDRSKNFYGVDLHPEVELVKKIVQNKKISANLQKANVTNLPFPDNFFDGILCLSVLEFVTDVNKAILEIKRVAKPQATIIIGIPVLNPVTNFLYKHVIKFKNHSSAHINSHQTIIDLVAKNFDPQKTLAYPGFIPLQYSLFSVLKAKRTKTKN